MSDNLQLQLARSICEKNRTRREYVALKRRYSLLSRKVNEESTDDGAENAFVGTPRRLDEREQRQAGVLEELTRLMRFHPSRRRYSVSLIAMALAIYLMSSSTYTFIREFLPLPSRQTLQAKAHAAMHFDKSMLQNLSAIPAIVARYRERSKLHDEKIEGILAVDAISFTRELIVSKTGVVYGSLQNETIDQKRLVKLHASFSELEELWKQHHPALISDAFVFQFQPVNASLKSLVVHVCPSSQGKATEKTVELLYDIDARLQDVNLAVIGYGMDGDTAYAKLHNNFYNVSLRHIKDDPLFANFSDVTGKLIISDPLHLLKRARYRLLATNIHIGLTEASEWIDIDVLRSILSLPSKTFSNQKFTKMHDDLAVSLFSMGSLAEIYKGKVEYAAYFLPFCLLNAALSESGLTVEERINFLEVTFYYMVAYIEELRGAPIKLPDRKSGTRIDVRPFPLSLAVETCNTAASVLAVLYRFNGTINLNRLGTNPLEHTFGAIRMRSRYKHTYENMIHSVGTTETWKQLTSFLGVGSRITGRKTYYGQTAFVKLGRFTNVLPMNARDIVLAHHMSFGLPVSSMELESWNLNYVARQCDSIVEKFSVSLSVIHHRMYPHGKQHRLNSRSICVTAGSNVCMIKRDDEVN